VLELGRHLDTVLEDGDGKHLLPRTVRDNDTDLGEPTNNLGLARSHFLQPV
jgi:hypothetical protein